VIDAWFGPVKVLCEFPAAPATHTADMTLQQAREWLKWLSAYQVGHDNEQVALDLAACRDRVAELEADADESPVIEP
jgi:hypothetical protein